MESRAIATTIFLFLQTCAAASLIHDCPPSSCGSIHNISYPFRLRGDPPRCGDKRYEFHCENNATVLTLFSGKYHVQEIDYKRYKIRVRDAGVVEEDATTCSFMPRYFLYSGNFSVTFFGPGPDPLRLDGSLASIAYFHCTDPITDDPRYVAVESTGCGSVSEGHIYAVVRDSRNDFGLKDIKVGCHLKVATLANWGTMKPNQKVTYADVRNMLSHGFGLSWLYVICEERCGEGKDCSVVDESTGEVQCDQPLMEGANCRWVYNANQSTYKCDGDGVLFNIITAIGLYGIGVYRGFMQFVGLNKATGYNEIEVGIGNDMGRYVLPYIIIRFLFGLVAFIVLLIYKWRRRNKSN